MEENRYNRLNTYSNEASMGSYYSGGHPGNVIYYSKMGARLKNAAVSGLKGQVVIKIYVAGGMNHFCATIVQSAGPQLDAEALRLAIRGFWMPKSVNGYTVPTWQQVTVIF